jgi:hypothetical protein
MGNARREARHTGCGYTAHCAGADGGYSVYPQESSGFPQRRILLAVSSVLEDGIKGTDHP